MKIRFRKLTGLGLISVSSLCFSAGLFAASGTVSIIPNDSATAMDPEVVTMGVPFARCEVTGASAAARALNFKLMDEVAGEVGVFVKETLTWPASAACGGLESTRAFKVQFFYDADTKGTQTYSWESIPRTMNEIEQTVTEVASPDPFKKADGGAALMEPRVFALHDPAYLVTTGIVSPTTVKGTNSYDDGLFPANFLSKSKGLDYTIISGVAHWLFDRPSTNYIQALRTQNIDYYREAYLSHEYWIDRIELTGTNDPDDPDFCLGGFDRDIYHPVTMAFQGNKTVNDGAGSTACDAKYIYAQPAKLHLALTGDDSWEPGLARPDMDTRDEVWIAMATTLFSGDNRGGAWAGRGAVPEPGFAEFYDDIDDLFTERKKGLGLQTVLNVCELTLDATVCGWTDTIIDNLHDMQNNNRVDKADGVFNVGAPGYLSHSWFRHEGDLPYIGEIETSTTGTTIEVGKLIDEVSSISIGNSLFLRVAGADPNPRITSISTSGAGASEVWTLGLDRSVTVVAGDRVDAHRVDPDGLSGPADSNTKLDLISDRAFSPWMQSNIVDGVWQYYNWTEDAGRKTKARELILGMGQAVAKYGIDGTRAAANPTAVATTAAVNLAFFGLTVPPATSELFDSGYSGGCGIESPIARYSSSTSIVNSNPKLTTDFARFRAPDNFMDQHTPEIIFQLSLAVYFETDPLKRDAMQALIDDSLEYFDEFACTKLTAGNPNRAFNWQNKPDPWGTYEFVSNYAITYPAMAKFTENLSNDGMISNTLALTLGGVGAEFTPGTLTKDTHYTTNAATVVPGLDIPTITVTDPTSATVTLAGTAASHDLADDVANLEIIFLDAAFVGHPAIRIENSTKVDIGVEFTQGVLNFDASEFTERATNDGGTDTVINITLTGTDFTGVNGLYTAGDQYNVTGLPAGFTPIVTKTGANSLTFALGSNQIPHRDADDVAASTITFSLTDNAFTIPAIGILNSTKTDFTINFNDATLSYSGDTFTEANTNDGTTPTILNLTLTGGETFTTVGALTGTHFTTNAAEPNPQVIEITTLTTTTATVALTGTAAASANANDVVNALEISFLDAAFTGASAASVIGSTKSDLSVDFGDANITYDTETFVETGSDSGATATVLTLTLAFDDFAAGPFDDPTHYSLANVPAGLTPVVTRTGANTVTFALTGAATAHETADDVANLTLNFTDAAFVGANAAGVVNASKSNLAVDFNSAAPPPPPPPAGGSGGSGGSGGATEGLVVAAGETRVRPGEIQNLTNAGTVIGASLGGTTRNEGGVLEDTELLEGSELTGGTMRGSLSGSGRVASTILDIDSISEDIVLGFGTEVTSGTVSKVPGLNLEDALRRSFLTGSGRSIDSGRTLLIDETDGELSLAEIAKEGIDKFFGNNSAVVSELAFGGNVLIENNDLLNESVAVPVLPQTVVTTTNPDGVNLDAAGNLVVTNRGIETTYSPAAANESALRESFGSLDASLEQISGGVFQVELGDITYFIRPSLLATLPQDSSTSGLQFLEVENDSTEATFEVVGSPADIANFKLVAHYPDGSSQVFNPYVHDLESFEFLMSHMAYTFIIDGATGVLEYYGTSGQPPLFRGVPDYMTTVSAEGVTDISLVSAGDLNGDGLEDMLFVTPDWTQRIYGVSP